tara:strand:- start:59 stop:487 length:429 start_codon:yes stop_codon:yes gene_type:complete
MKKPTKPIKKTKNRKKTTRGTKTPPNTRSLPSSNIKRPGDGLTEIQKKELENISKKITKTAKNVVKDYNDTPSQTSGSVIQINQDSPYLDEKHKGDQWKKVINKMPPRTPKDLNKKVPKLEQKNSKSLKSPVKASKPGWAKK